jgi:hypothetical protein
MSTLAKLDRITLIDRLLQLCKRRSCLGHIVAAQLRQHARLRRRRLLQSLKDGTVQHLIVHKIMKSLPQLPYGMTNWYCKQHIRVKQEPHTAQCSSVAGFPGGRLIVRTWRSRAFVFPEMR